VWFGYLWIVSPGNKAALLFDNRSFILEPPNFHWRWVTSDFTLQLHGLPSFFGDVAKQLYESQRPYKIQDTIFFRELKKDKTKGL
jgi:hypothetical protein